MYFQIIYILCYRYTLKQQHRHILCQRVIFSLPITIQIFLELDGKQHQHILPMTKIIFTNEKITRHISPQLI